MPNVEYPVRNYKNSSLEDYTKLEEISTLTNQIQNLYIQINAMIYSNIQGLDNFSIKTNNQCHKL